MYGGRMHRTQAKFMKGMIGMKRKTPNYKKRTIIFSSVMTVILAVMIAANVAAFGFADAVLDNYFMRTVEQDGTNNTTSEADWHKVAEEIEAEGAVLLKNENNALPLKASTQNKTKINLLGYIAYSSYFSGTGSGASDTTNAVTLTSALTANGFEINSAPIDEKIYEEVVNDAGGMTNFNADFSILEPNVSYYKNSATFDNMKAYSSTAVVVIGRTGGENCELNDYIPITDNVATSPEGTTAEMVERYGSAENANKHYLELTVNEEELIKNATETFDKVIVLYNGSNALEMGFLDEYGVDAALWMGTPGAYGFNSVAKLLNGTYNPSGRLTDTYAYDAMSAPAMKNFGSNEYSNLQVTDMSWYRPNQTYAAHYVDYVEGIYVGYKWYETADETGYFAAHGTSYDQQVQFSFGHGLSYTTFTQELQGGWGVTNDGSSIRATGEINLTVRVTNTGNVAGKDVVQVYVSAPYTSYDIANGVEKASVSLVTYAKTGEIQPGEYEDVEISFAVEDLASYDSTHSNGDGTKGAYMLDEGTYTISIRDDSHTVETIGKEKQEISVNLANTHFFSGNDKRSSDVVAASNHFDEAARGTYLSRNNAFANFETAMNSVTDVADEATIAAAKDASKDEGDTYDASYDTAVTKTYKAGVDYRTGDWSVPSDAITYTEYLSGEYSEEDFDRVVLTLSDMQGIAYENEEMWNKLISQMSLEEMQDLISQGGWATIAIESIGKVREFHLDGPTGLNSLWNPELNEGATSYPGSVVVASTWNSELIEEFGKCMADEFHAKGVTALYAPAMNTHRTPFAGRNFEYYSEDAVVGAITGGSFTKGARENGLIVYIKHFALNDQETNCRDYLMTWSNEQAIREIYLKPFENSVKYGGATAIMTSYNFIGYTWSGRHAGLLTDVTRGEWGFKGMFISDAVTHGHMIGAANVDSALRAGGDMWLVAWGYSEPSVETNADIHYVIRATKNILYTEANAIVIPSEILPWRLWMGLLDALLGITFCVLGVCLVKNIRDSKKESVKKNKKKA